MADVSATEVRRLVRLLGTTPNAIARSLANKGVVGLTGEDDQCPLARFLQGELGRSDAELYVGSDRVGLVTETIDADGYPTDDTDEVMLPKYAQRFIADFDDGKYPDLVDPDDDFFGAPPALR